MNTEESKPQDAGADRRQFLANAGRFALVVPPVMTVLLSTSLSSTAIAQSGGEPQGKGSTGNNGGGNGCDGQPKGAPKENDTASC